MKKIYLFLLASIFTFSVSSQSFNSEIENIISSVNLDSLVYTVRALSGEDSAMVDGEKVLIKNRSANYGNELAAVYISERLENYGYDPIFQNFGSDGTNVIAIKTGTDFPNQYYMICAHYDAVTFFAADDNASGTATVIEAARLLSGMEFPYSIIFALWDEEEIGLIGSRYYADNAANIGLNIDGVINIDMIGWDGNNDGLIEVHTSSVNNSLELSDFVLNINSIYSLDLSPSLKNPGTPYSDHSSFWDNNYSALLLIEGYYSNDFNPYYHSVNDRIEIFNLPYFHESAKLAIGSLSALATANITDINETNNQKIEGLSMIASHPNPFTNETSIDITIISDSRSQVFVLNSLGEKVKEIYHGYLKEGNYQFDLTSEKLDPGFYYVILQTEQELISHKMIIIR